MNERKTDRPGTAMHQTDVMPRKSGARLGREVQTKIGQQLDKRDDAGTDKGAAE